MKFTFDRLEMVSAINRVSSAIPSKSTIPSLEGIKMDLDYETLHITGYDLEIGIMTSIEVDSGERGEILFGKKLFSDIVRTMSGDDVTVEIDGNLNATISSGGATYNISSMPASEYPDIPTCQKDPTKSVTIKQALLKNMISQTLFAAATSDTRPILKGELFDIEGGIFNLVALDGSRLAMRSEKVPLTGCYYFVVPSKTLMEVNKLLSDGDDDCIIYTSRKHIIFDISGCQVVSRLLEGDFHNYRNSIPKEHKTEVTVNVRSLIDMVGRCSLLISEKARAAVRCKFSDEGKLHILCQSTIGKFSEEMPLKLEGETVEAGFNHRLLLDALKATESDEVKLLLSSSNSPMKIVPLEGDAFTFLVLPMRIR